MSSGLFLATSAMLLTLPVVAHAQSVNYPELEEMFGEPVTTSVTGKPQRASEAPAALTIITRDDIRRAPARDIPGLIQAYAGIDVVRWTAGQADVVVRGGVQAYNPRLLVLVNGQQVYLDYYGVTNWSGLGVQLEEIQQIEIVRGPNSALYGFNAASGVINIITIDPLQTQQLVTTAEAGSEGYLRVSQSAAIKLTDHLGLRLSGGYEKLDELSGLKDSTLNPRPGISIFNPWHKEVVGELYAKIDEQTDARLGVTYSNNQRLEVPTTLYTLPLNYQFVSLGAHVSHDTGWGVLTANAYQNWSDIKVLINPDEILVRNKIFVASLDTTIRASTSNTLRLGLEYRRNELRILPGYPGSTRYDAYAASGMWESMLSDAVTLSIAGRLDHLVLDQAGVVNQPTIFTKADFNRSVTEWSFNTALIFKLDETSRVRVVASRGVQSPSLISFGARLEFQVPQLPLPIIFSGNPFIDPATTWSAEIGYTREFGASGNHLELIGFYNRTSDVISSPIAQTPLRATPPAYPFFLSSAENVGSFHVFGLEASLTGKVGQSWHWALNYSWTKVGQEIAGNQGGQFAWPLALDRASPRNKVKLGLSYEKGAWLASIAARYTSAIRQLVAVNPIANAPLELVAIKDSLALDAKLAYKVSDRLTLTVAGENLTGAAGVDLSPAPAERRLRAGVQVRF